MQCPRKKQVLMFSATMTDGMRTVARKLMNKVLYAAWAVHEGNSAQSKPLAWLRRRPVVVACNQTPPWLMIEDSKSRAFLKHSQCPL